jgi:predicted O-linked N-acetylglucosamine transferase (SPINDLY family)
MITRRPDTAADRDEVTRRTQDAGLDRLIFAGDTQKEDAARAAGEQIDIWIDDYPAGIPTA